MAHSWISFIPICLLDAASSQKTILKLHALCKASGLTSDDSFLVNWLPTSEMNKRVYLPASWLLSKYFSTDIEELEATTC